MPFSKSLDVVLESAPQKAGAMRLSQTTEAVLIIAIAKEGRCAASQLLSETGLTEDLLTRTTLNLFPSAIEHDGPQRPEMSPEASASIDSAAKLAEQAQHPSVTPSHLLSTLLKCAATQKLLRAAFLSHSRREPTVATHNGQTAYAGSFEDRLKELTLRTEQILSGRDSIRDSELTPSILAQLTVDLTDLARKKSIQPVIGRQKELTRTIQILGRKSKNNPVLIGEPGVGKSAIAEGLAIEIVNGRVPRRLQQKRVLRLDLTALVAGTSYRGQFEERIKQLIDELVSNKDCLTFVDELHTLIGAGASQGGLDASNILKPVLARGEVTLIGATTLDEYRRYIEKDGALTRRFQPVMVVPSTREETVEILSGLRDGLEKHHGVRISDEALMSAARMADLYITGRALPDKAIDLLDESASALAILNPEGELGEEHIQAQISQMTGIQLERLSKDEIARLSSMEKDLEKRVIGQRAAISAVSRAVRRARSGLKDEKRPIGSFLFIGPTGVGKTELSKALAEFMFGDESSLLRLDMSEFMERHCVSRMIGAPPGYVGYEEGGKLTEAVRRRPYCVLLLDEIEKAHPDVFDVLLQVMDDGRLTDGQGRLVDFKNAIIIMTSNLGASLISNALSESNGEEVDLLSKTMPVVAKHFRPEFLNRLDEIVCFSHLSREQIDGVLQIQLKGLRQRLQNSQQVSLELDEDALRFLSDEGYVAKYGARELRRVIQRRLEDPLCEMIVGGNIEQGGRVKVQTAANGLVLTSS